MCYFKHWFISHMFIAPTKHSYFCYPIIWFSLFHMIWANNDNASRGVNIGSDNANAFYVNRGDFQNERMRISSQKSHDSSKYRGEKVRHSMLLQVNAINLSLTCLNKRAIMRNSQMIFLICACMGWALMPIVWLTKSLHLGQVHSYACAPRFIESWRALLILLMISILCCSYSIIALIFHIVVWLLVKMLLTFLTVSASTASLDQ